MNIAVQPRMARRHMELPQLRGRISEDRVPSAFGLSGALNFADLAVLQLEKLWGKVPPCVSYAILNTWLNGWGTAQRFQVQDSSCWLHEGCPGKDAIEHYAVCACHWDALWAKARISPTRSLESFLLLTDDSEAGLRIRACHLYAVRNAVIVRKAEGCRRSRLAVDRLIEAGHKTAMLVDRSLCRVYRQEVLTRSSQERRRPEQCPDCGLEMFECNCIEDAYIGEMY